MTESLDESKVVAKHPLGDKRVLCWAMYDWANSAYTTLLITVLIAYVQRVVFPPQQWGQTGAVVWAWGISFSMFVGALLSPVVGAIADARASKRQWLAATAMAGSLASILLGIVPPQMYVLVVILFVTANLMLELSLAVYNGFLSEIAVDDQTNSVSAWGYGLGYIGGGVALVLAMLILRYGGYVGLPTLESRLRCGLVLMGAWWALFTLPAVIVLRDKPRISKSTSLTGIIRSSARDVAGTVRGLRSNTALLMFLLSFLFYNDGIQTVISQASTFALQELAFPEAELMAVILMIQFLAFPGSLIISRMADRLGQQRSLMICLMIWSGVLITSLAVDSKAGFWSLAAVIAVVLGGTQSVSRSLMASMIPSGQSAQYFGFFNLSGKATSFLGTFAFGAIVATTGSARLAVFGLLPLFILGALFMMRVNTDAAPQKKRGG